VFGKRQLKIDSELGSGRDFQLLLREVAEGTVVAESTSNPLIRTVDPFSLTACENGQEELKSWSLLCAEHPPLANER
jgi:hypothetical protein